MIALELAFRPTPQRLAARTAHRTILHRLHVQGVVVAAGPWADDSGALLLFAADRDRVREIVASDPYCATEGVTVVALREWNPVVSAYPKTGGSPTVSRDRHTYSGRSSNTVREISTS